MVWWYVTFSKEAGWVGGAHVEADSGVDAVNKALELGIVDEDDYESTMSLPAPNGFKPQDQYCNKLLNIAEVKASAGTLEHVILVDDGITKTTRNV